MADEVHALSLTELRRRKSVKWRQFSSDVLPLPVAEMDFPIAEPIKSALRDMIDRSDTGYLGPFPEMFEAFQDFASDAWGWRPEIDQMRIATDVGVGTVEVIRTLINPGDRVILNAPVYDNMWRWVAEVRAELVNVPLQESGMQYQMDFEALERAYANGAKAHILCNPHNPVGILFSKQELARVAELAKAYGVTVISDEIHGALTYPGAKFEPFLGVSDEAREIGITVTSASKAFNLAGLKCAMIITSSEKLRERINSMPISVAFRASLFGAVAASAAFRDSRSWLTGALRTLDENRRLIDNLISTKLPAIGYRMPDFGYLAWLDLTGLGLGEDPTKVILERGKLAINSGSMYSPKHSNFARLNFGTSPEIISEAFDRIQRCL
jgi:cystathionine beta-lyase